jgi:hypothetical protein
VRGDRNVLPAGNERIIGRDAARHVDHARDAHADAKQGRVSAADSSPNRLFNPLQNSVHRFALRQRTPKAVHDLQREIHDGCHQTVGLEVDADKTPGNRVRRKQRGPPAVLATDLVALEQKALRHQTVDVDASR